MKKRKAKHGEKIYLIKATLSGWRGQLAGTPYRILAIPGGFTLYNLAEAIVDSFDFYFDHAFGFYNNIQRWTRSTEGYELFADIGEESHFKGVKRTKISKVFDKVRKKMLFLFDYGDQWNFIVELIRIESPEDGAEYPLVVESVGIAPRQYGEIDEEEAEL